LIFKRFQCYDKYLLADLNEAAQSVGHPEWSNPPSNAGFYNSYPSNAPFFEDGQANNYASAYGSFFLGNLKISNQILTSLRLV
jgi:beta-amylase